MQIIFDKDTENQRAIAIDFFGENLFRGNLNASWNRQLDAEAAVPNVAALKEVPTFSSVEIVDTVGDESFSVPVQGRYNTILDASAAYNAQSRQYSVTIVLDYVAAE